MGQRGVGVEAGNGAEAGRDEIRPLAAEFQQHPVDVQLIEHFAPGQAGLEVGKEMAERHAVLDHRLTGVGHVGRRLDGLEERAGVDRLDDRHRALERLQRAGGHLGRVHQQAVRQPGDVICRLLVGRHRNACRCQRLRKSRTDPGHILRRHITVSQQQRVVLVGLQKLLASLRRQVFGMLADDDAMMSRFAAVVGACNPSYSAFCLVFIQRCFLLT